MKCSEKWRCHNITPYPYNFNRTYCWKRWENNFISLSTVTRYKFEIPDGLLEPDIFMYFSMTKMIWKIMRIVSLRAIKLILVRPGRNNCWDLRKKYSSDHTVHLEFCSLHALFKYIENFTSQNWKFSDKKILIFFIFLLKNIDCGYSLDLTEAVLKQF